MATEWDGSPFSILVRIRGSLLPSDSELGFFAARVAGPVARGGEDSRNFVMFGTKQFKYVGQRKHLCALALRSRQGVDGQP